MRKILIGFVVIAVIGIAVHFRFHRAKPPLEVAYAANREVTLWSTTAQVRSAVATVNFGDPLDVIDRFSDQVQVRTASGIVGWASERDLLSADFWQRAKNTNTIAATLPVEAHGHTRVLSNLHLDPGRNSPRIRQLSKDVPLELFERRIESVPSPSNPGAQEVSANSAPEAKKEDWWLVRAHFPDQTSLSGWLLARFIDLDVPEPLPDYASSAGVRIVAWFELNRVSDTAGKTKPQYLVVGDRGSEGQVCDFTLMRVFTWGHQRQRYETAFVESDVCGQLPVKLTPAITPGGDASFAFLDLSGGVPEDRLYRMHQTIVRRVREGGAGGPPPSTHKKRR
ncbi:MAG: hypothetical protein ABSA57_10405 [Candidatus Acidiferrales bacterium]|jgi:hypothetical protein